MQQGDELDKTSLDGLKDNANLELAKHILDKTEATHFSCGKDEKYVTFRFSSNKKAQEFKQQLKDNEINFDKGNLTRGNLPLVKVPKAKLNDIGQVLEQTTTPKHDH